MIATKFTIEARDKYRDRLSIVYGLPRITNEYSTIIVDSDYVIEQNEGCKYKFMASSPLCANAIYDNRSCDFELMEWIYSVSHQYSVDWTISGVVSHGFLAELLWLNGLKKEFHDVICSSVEAQKYIRNYPRFNPRLRNTARKQKLEIMEMVEFARVCIANMAALNVLRELGL